MTPTPSAQFTLCSVQDTCLQCQVDPARGLDASDAQDLARRRRLHGQNRLAEEDGHGGGGGDAWDAVHKFLEQIRQPLNGLLLASAAVSVLMGQWDDAVSIAAAILIVVAVAMVQEYRSERSLEALRELVPHDCHVVRSGGQSAVISAESLLVGDVVRFQTGDRIPADLRLIHAVDVQVDESNLSGETKPCRKQTEPVLPPHTATATGDGALAVVPVVERTNIAYMGTLVRSGHGMGVVVAVGRHTEFGAIWAMMKEVAPQKTPLQLKMEELGKHLSFLSFGVISVITLLGLAQGHRWLDTFTVAVSLAVAAIPEGLPIVVTVTLALGVMRMAKKNAIVKLLPSVESLGSVNVLCADKTGTLTTNQMVVTQLYTVVDGVVGVDHNDHLFSLSKRTTVQQLLRCASLCNNAVVEAGEQIGQPTEIALLDLMHRFHYKDERDVFKRVAEIPFDSEQKWMAVQCDMGQQQLLQFVKGAPEVILSKCGRFVAGESTGSDAGSTYSVSPTGSGRNSAETALAPNVKAFTQDYRNLAISMSERLSSQGLRVIALAYGTDLADLIFVGFAAMYDPPRKGVPEVINSLTAGGVRVVMITGDSQSTALSIAKQLGILSNSAALAEHVITMDGGAVGQNGLQMARLQQSATMSGGELDKMTERQIQDAVKHVSVFYRTTPRHKLQIIKAFQARGDVVAMTGDGVNDAPALKLADIGVAMGKSGTDVSKEAADMILVDDDLSTILTAIEEGKSIFYNIRNFLRFQLSTSIAALSLIASSTVLGLKNPMNAMQILWINIIMDGPPAQSLGVEPADPDVMRKPPRPKNANIIDKPLIIRVLVSAFLIVSGTMYIYYGEMHDGVVTAKDTTKTFTTFVFFDMFNALSSRSEKKSVFTIGLLSNKPFLYAVSASIICQLCVIYVPFFQRIFQTEPLEFTELLRIALLSSTVWVVDELRKFYFGPWAMRRKLARMGKYTTL